MIWQVAQLFTRGALVKSARGLAVQTGGFVALQQTVELAASYNDWIAENKDFILNTAAVATVGRGLATNPLARKAIVSAAKSPTAWIAGLAGATTYSGFAVNEITASLSSSDSLSESAEEVYVRWRQPGALESGWVRAVIPRERGSIGYKSSDPALAAHLAVTAVGGLSELFDDSTRLQAIEDFTLSLKAEVLVFTKLAADEAVMKDIANTSPLALLSNSRSIAESLSRQHPSLSMDEIASKIVRSLLAEENHNQDGNSITYGVSRSGDEIFVLNDFTMYISSETGDLSMRPFDNSQDMALTGAKPKHAHVFAKLFEHLIDVLSVSPNVPFFRSPEDSLVFTTKPMIHSGYYLGIARTPSGEEWSKLVARSADDSGIDLDEVALTWKGEWGYWFVGGYDDGGVLDDIIETVTFGAIDLSDSNLIESIESVKAKSTIESYADDVLKSVALATDVYEAAFDVTAGNVYEAVSNAVAGDFSLADLVSPGEAYTEARKENFATDEIEPEEIEGSGPGRAGFVGNEPVSVISGYSLLRKLNLEY